MNTVIHTHTDDHAPSHPGAALARRPRPDASTEAADGGARGANGRTPATDSRPHAVVERPYPLPEGHSSPAETIRLASAGLASNRCHTDLHSQKVIGTATRRSVPAVREAQVPDALSVGRQVRP